MPRRFPQFSCLTFTLLMHHLLRTFSILGRADVVMWYLWNSPFFNISRFFVNLFRLKAIQHMFQLKHCYYLLCPSILPERWLMFSSSFGILATLNWEVESGDTGRPKLLCLGRPRKTGLQLAPFLSCFCSASRCRIVRVKRT